MAQSTNPCKAKDIVQLLFVDTSDNSLIQLFRYLFVGGFAFVVDFGLLFLLTDCASFYYIVSATISFIAGLGVNYLLSTRWIFRHSRLKNKAAEFAVYALIGVVGLLLNDLLIYVFTEFADFHYLVSKLLTTALVMLWNFFGRKLILFNTK